MYEFSTRENGRLRIEKIDLTRLPACDTESDIHGRDGGGRDTGGAALEGEPVSAEDSGVVIDLLVVYSNDALTWAGSTAAIEAHAQAAVDNANASFTNSNMTARYRLVHTAYVNHDTLGTTSNDLGWVVNSAEVAALRDQYGADMVTILVDTPSSCGTAYVQRNPGPGFEAPPLLRRMFIVRWAI